MDLNSSVADKHFLGNDFLNKVREQLKSGLESKNDKESNESTDLTASEGLRILESTFRQVSINNILMNFYGNDSTQLVESLLQVAWDYQQQGLLLQSYEVHKKALRSFQMFKDENKNFRLESQLYFRLIKIAFQINRYLEALFYLEEFYQLYPHQKIVLTEEQYNEDINGNIMIKQIPDEKLNYKGIPLHIKMLFIASKIYYKLRDVKKTSRSLDKLLSLLDENYDEYNVDLESLYFKGKIQKEKKSERSRATIFYKLKLKILNFQFKNLRKTRCMKEAIGSVEEIIKTLESNKKLKLMNVEEINHLYLKFELRRLVLMNKMINSLSSSLNPESIKRNTELKNLFFNSFEQLIVRMYKERINEKTEKNTSPQYQTFAKKLYEFLESCLTLVDQSRKLSNGHLLGESLYYILQSLVMQIDLPNSNYKLVYLFYLTGLFLTKHSFSTNQEEIRLQFTQCKKLARTLMNDKIYQSAEQMVSAMKEKLPPPELEESEEMSLITALRGQLF